MLPNFYQSPKNKYQSLNKYELLNLTTLFYRPEYRFMGVSRKFRLQRTLKNAAKAICYNGEEKSAWVPSPGLVIETQFIIRGLLQVRHCYCWVIELVLPVGPIFNDCELASFVFLSDKFMLLPDCTSFFYMFFSGITNQFVVHSYLIRVQGIDWICCC